MNIINEVGLVRILKYLIFSLWFWLFDNLPFSPLRVFWLRLGGATIGKNCFISKVDFINLDRKGLKGLFVGNECFLGSRCLIDLAGSVRICNSVTISPRVILLTHFSVGYSTHPLIKKYPKYVVDTTLKYGCFIGAGSIILPGITIGKCSLVAAGSVVRENVSDNSMVAGVPAKIKKR